MNSEQSNRDLKSWVGILWGLRINRDLLNFEREFASFKELCGTTEWKLEADLLESAALRAKGKLAESQELALSLRVNPKFNDSTRASLQVGLNYLMQNQDTEAWAYFMECSEKVEDRNSRLMALGNLVICLNNLGIPHREKLEALETLASEELEKNNPIAKAILAQNLAIFLKDDFRAGEWDQFFKRFDESEFRQGQASFIAAWASRLPYVKSESKKNFEWIHLNLVSDVNLFKQSSRLQTILGMKDDNLEMKLHEHIDRLYLWTWRHLVDPLSIPLGWVLHELEMIKKESEQTASFEDYQMLRNALGWILLLDGREVSDWTNAFDLRFRIGDREDKILNLEWKFIKELEDHVFKKNKALESFPANEFTCAFKDTAFALRLHKIRSSNIPPKSGSNVFSDKGVIMTPQKTIIDHQLAKFLNSLKNEMSLSFSKIALEIFGAHSYDSALHADQITRLVQKAKTYLFDKDAIMIRSEYVLRVSPLEEVQVMNIPFGSPSDFMSWQSLNRHFAQTSYKVPEEPVADWMSVLTKKEVIYRQELQDELNWSKAKTNRMIAEAIESGWLEKSGSGNNIYYKVLINQSRE